MYFRLDNIRFIIRYHQEHEMFSDFFCVVFITIQEEAEKATNLKKAWRYRTWVSLDESQE